MFEIIVIDKDWRRAVVAAPMCAFHALEKEVMAMFKSIVVGIGWGILMRGIVAVPAWVLQAPDQVVIWITLFAACLGWFLWYIMPPLMSNDDRGSR